MNGCEPVPEFDPSQVKQTVNKWIIGKIVEAERDISMAIDVYKFNEAAQLAYAFTWGTFCDWYLEFIKPILQEDGESVVQKETRATAAWALDQVLHLLHPIMPFITEELWQTIANNRPSPLIRSPWPELNVDLINKDANNEMDWLVRLITEIRSIRSEMNVPPKAEVGISIAGAGDLASAATVRHSVLLKRLARLEAIDLVSETEMAISAKGAIQFVIEEATVFVGVANVIDLVAEQDRLENELDSQQSEIERFEKKLANKNFVTKAPANVVQAEREKLANAKVVRTKLKMARKRLVAAR